MKNDNLYIRVKSPGGSKIIKKVANSTKLILDVAETYGIKWKQLPHSGIFQLTYGNDVQYFHKQTPFSTTSLGKYCCDNKRICKRLLQQASISTPKGYEISNLTSESETIRIFDKLTKPCVVKPIKESNGVGVHLFIQTKQQFLDAISTSKKNNKLPIIVEEMFIGDEYRILTTQKRVISIIKRIPANVVGDGVSTIRELINKKNQHPYRQSNKYPLKKIKFNQILRTYLDKQNLSTNSVLEKGKIVFLNQHHSLQAINNGGDTIDITNQVHHSVKEIALKAIQAIPGLAMCGIDFLSIDITQEQAPDRYRVLELNASPSLDWQEYPLLGIKQHVCYEFLKTMFPKLKHQS